MFGHLMTHWYKGEIDPPGTPNVLFCRLFPKLIICEICESDMKFYVNGRSTSIPVEKLAALKCQYLNKCTGKMQTASSSHHTVFALRQTNQF